MQFDDFTLDTLAPAASPLAYTTSTLPSFVTFDSPSRTFTISSNDNADALLSPYTIEVYAVDANSVSTDPTTPASFQLTVNPYTVVLTMPTDMIDMEYVIGNPTETHVFSHCTSDYLGPLDLVYSA